MGQRTNPNSSLVRQQPQGPVVMALRRIAARQRDQGFALVIQFTIPVGLGMVAQHAVQSLLGVPPFGAEHRALRRSSAATTWFALHPSSVRSRMRARVITRAACWPLRINCRRSSDNPAATPIRQCTFDSIPRCAREIGPRPGALRSGRSHGRLHILATFAEFEADLIRCTRIVEAGALFDTSSPMTANQRSRRLFSVSTTNRRCSHTTGRIPLAAQRQGERRGVGRLAYLQGLLGSVERRGSQRLLYH